MAICVPNEETWTVAELKALKRASVRSIKEITYDGKKTVFNSVDEMLTLIALMERDIYPCAVKQRGTRVYAQTSKGLC